MCAAGRVPGRDPEEGPGDIGDEREDEDAGGTTSRLPETHRRAEGITLREGRTLQHDAS